MTTPQPGAAVVLHRVADLIETHYVVAEHAPCIAERLRIASSMPDPTAEPDEFAEVATALLRVHNGDQHLSVCHLPEGVEDEQDEVTWRRWYAAQARANAGGVSTVSREGGVATLVIAPYLSPVECGRSYSDAAMLLVDGARALVIDLRACRGGTPSAVAHLCSYLLGPEPIHLQDVIARDGTIERFTTEPHRLAAPRQADLPVRVLTSSGTFSGGEDLAYSLQALGRATVVGERTGGGAHPRQAFALTATLEVHVPVARSVNAVTGGNWEGTGVVPDLLCPAGEAPARARAALSVRP